MKRLLLPFLLLTNIYAVSIETSADTTLNEREIDELLQMDQELDAQGAAALKVLEDQKRVKEEEALKKKQEKESKEEQAKVQKEQEDSAKSKNANTSLFIIGIGGGSGTGESVLANANDELINPFSSNKFLLRAGLIWGNFDFILQYNGSGVTDDQTDYTLGVNSFEGQVKYRVYTFGSGTFQYAPVIGAGYGSGNLDTFPDSTGGIHFMGTAGLQIFIATNYVIEAAFVFNKAYWDYPIDGIESSFQTGGFDLAFEYRF